MKTQTIKFLLLIILLFVLVQFTGCDPDNPDDNESKEHITKKQTPNSQTISQKPARLLLFSLSTGFLHQSEVFVDEMIKKLAEETGDFTIEYILRITFLTANIG